MERSALEAIMIGVNVFVFIIALSSAILLMTSIMNITNYANQIVYSGMNGSIAETVGVVHNRTYSGYELLNYYKSIEKGTTDSNFFVKLTSTSTPINLKDYISSQTIGNYINNTYELEYKGKRQNSTNGKYIDEYVFLLQVDNVD